MSGFEKYQNLFDRSISLIMKLRHREGLDIELYDSLLKDVVEGLDSQKHSSTVDKGLVYIAFNVPYMMENLLGIYDVAEMAEEYAAIEGAALQFREQVEIYFDGFQLAR